MDADITEQEIAQALDDPMFGGPISGTATNAEIDERVYGRRYVNKMEVRNFPGGSPDVDPPPHRGRVGRLRQGIGSFGRRFGDYMFMRQRDPVTGSVLGWDPEGNLLKEVDESLLFPPPSHPESGLGWPAGTETWAEPLTGEKISPHLGGVDPAPRSGIAKLKARALRAAWHRTLPAMAVAAGATVLSPLAALAQGVGDVILSPEQLGSGLNPRTTEKLDMERLYGSSGGDKELERRNMERYRARRDYTGPLELPSGMGTFMPPDPYSRLSREAGVPILGDARRRGYARGGAVMNNGIGSLR
jgi:hypothetical protein